MRLGIYSGLGMEDPKEWAEELKKAGCGCAVFPVDDTASPETIDAFVKEAGKWDLTIAEVGAWSNPLSPDPKERAAALEKCRRQLALADRVGARCCVNVAGAAGEYWAGAYRENFTEETWKRTVKAIQEIIDGVRPKHTYYAIEPMPYMYPMDPKQYVRLLEEVDRERFAVHMDFCNWLNSPEKYFDHEAYMEQCFELLGPYIKSCHIKDAKLTRQLTCQIREVPCGQGELNLKKYISLAETYDPQMPMITEHLKTNEEYLKSIAYLQKIGKQRVQKEAGRS